LGGGEAGFAGELAVGVRGGTAFFAVHVDDDPFLKWKGLRAGEGSPSGPFWL
jgi:hypothetical protein